MKNTTVHYDTASKTERQWNDLGYKLKANAKGELLWINRSCPSKSWYYEKSQVRKMSEKQFKKYRHERYVRKKQRTLELAEIRRKQQERWEREEREREERYLAEQAELERQAKEKLDWLMSGKCKIADVLIVGHDSYGNPVNDTYAYEVGLDAEVGNTGRFPFGDHSEYGKIVGFVTVKDLEKEWWFPLNLRKIKYLDKNKS